jgi:hypothetical protein
MNELEFRDSRPQDAAAERTQLGRVIAVGTIALWLVTMLLVMGPAAARGIF